MKMMINGLEFEGAFLFSRYSARGILDNAIEMNGDSGHGIAEVLEKYFELKDLGSSGTLIAEVIEMCLEDSTRDLSEAFLVRPTKSTAFALLEKALDEGVVELEEHDDLHGAVTDSTVLL